MCAVALAALPQQSLAPARLPTPPAPAPRLRVGVPYLRRVPLLGYLFKENEKRRFYTETVIYITPRIADQRFFEEPYIEQDVRERLQNLEQRDRKFKKRGWRKAKTPAAGRRRSQDGVRQPAAPIP